jgi:hypothetical protein
MIRLKYNTVIPYYSRRQNIYSISLSIPTGCDFLDDAQKYRTSETLSRNLSPIEIIQEYCGKENSLARLWLNIQRFQKGIASKDYLERVCHIYA